VKTQVTQLICDACGATIEYAKEEEHLPYFISPRVEDWLGVNKYHFCPNCVSMIKRLHELEDDYEVGLLNTNSALVKLLLGENKAWREAKFKSLRCRSGWRSLTEIPQEESKGDEQKDS
jgi:hypothetical protein